MPRFSLKWMLIGVAAVAIGCVALLYASPVWSGVAYAIALLLLCSAPALIVYRQAARRAYWIGFAAFGWTYFVLLACGFVDSPAGRLPTAKVLDALFDSVASRQMDSRQGVPQVGEFINPGDRLLRIKEAMARQRARVAIDGRVFISRQRTPSALAEFRREFSSVGHSLWIVVLGFLGGVIGRCAYATGCTREDA